jgi:hypothetical protein
MIAERVSQIDWSSPYVDLGITQTEEITVLADGAK